jgi:hypothetical protein
MGGIFLFKHGVRGGHGGGCWGSLVMWRWRWCILPCSRYVGSKDRSLEARCTDRSLRFLFRHQTAALFR